MSTILRIVRTDRAVEIQEHSDGYRVRVARLRGVPQNTDGLTAEQALHCLCDALRKTKPPRRGKARRAS